MFWNYFMKCVSNNLNDDYRYLQQPMIDIKQPHTTYQSTKAIIIQQPTKSLTTIFSNKRINAKPLKKIIQKINAQNVTINEGKVKHLSL